MFWTKFRRSFAQLILALFLSLWLLTSLQGWLIGEPEIARCFLMLAGCYTLAFLALGGEWFWARWFAIGLGNWGAVSLLAVFQVGPNPVILVFGGLHLMVTMLLWGPKMAERYELSEAWRSRWQLQESSVERLRNVVVSAGMTIPFLILYAFGPKEDGLVTRVLAFAPLAMAGIALVGLVRLRTWGVFALGATAALALVAGVAQFVGLGSTGLEPLHGWASVLDPTLAAPTATLFGAAPLFAALAAGVGFASLVPAMGRYLRRTR